MLNTGNSIQGYKKEQIADKRYWYLGRIRYTDLFFSELSRELVKVYNMAHSIPKKCLIVDLDGTLWGGIIGEDGRSNIILGQDGLGQAYQDFQREILKLYEKGIILAICSKNNESDVDILLHMDKRMLLKDEHFTSKRINWNDKASNIEEIAKEINIGLDSIVFLDDNPVEREWVRENLPEVTVPEMPEDPSRYAEFLKNSKWFNSYNTTKEDRIRNITYKAVAKSKKLKEKSKNINSFIRDLKQQVIIEDVNTSTISRAVQLSQKTNQFKMNHKRYELSEMKNMIKDKDYKIYTLSLKDCFCDYGIIGLMIMKNDHIDDFILSCRVIGRKIEDVIIDWLKKRLKKEGYSHIYGRYRTSTKNSVCKDVYKENGFISKEEGVLNTGGANTINKYNLKGKVGFSSFKDIIKVKYEGKR